MMTNDLSLAPPPPPGLNRGVSTTTKMVLIAFVAFALMLVVLGAAWFLVLGKSEENLGPDPFASVPRDPTVVQLAPIGTNFVVDDMGGNQATLTYGTIVVVRVANEDGSYLVAIDDTKGLPDPLWVTPTSDSTDCAVVGATLSCGQQNVNVETGFPADLPKSQEGGEDNVEEDSANDDSAEEGNAGEEVEGGEGEGKNDLAETEIIEDDGTDDDTDDGGEDGVETDLDAPELPESGDIVTGGQQLGSAATEDLPLAAAGGELLGEDGAVISSGLNTGNWWALKPSANRDHWLVSDGSVMLSVSGGKEQWRVVLPTGAAAASGFDDTPTWAASDGSVIVGTGEGILALDTQTGQDRWTVDTAVKNFRVGTSGVVVSDGDHLVYLPFPEPGLEDEGEGDPNPHTTVQTGPPAREVPTQEQFANATLEVPWYCVDPQRQGFSEGDTDYATFTNGFYERVGWMGSTQISYAQTVLNGEPAIVSALECVIDGSQVMTMLLAYDADLELLAARDLADGVATVPEDIVRWTVEVHGNTVDAVFRAKEDVGTLAGTSLSVWNASEFEVVDVVYWTSAGDRREPSVEAVQAAYGGPLEVVGCGRMPPGEVVYGGTTEVRLPDSDIIPAAMAPSGRMYWPEHGQIDGDWVCGLKGPRSTVDEWGRAFHNQWLIVRSDAAGRPEIIEEGTSN